MLLVIQRPAHPHKRPPELVSACSRVLELAMERLELENTLASCCVKCRVLFKSATVLTAEVAGEAFQDTLKMTELLDD